MSKQITNTLTRWHKIAERIKIAANEQSQKNLNSLNLVRSMDADTFSVRRGSLRTAALSAVGEQTELYFALQRALFEIPRELGRANIKFNVSDLLSQMEEAKQVANYYNSLLELTEDALSEAEYSSLVAKRGSGSSMGYGASVTFLAAEQIAEMTEKRDALKRRVNSLADKLADANASKLTLVIDDQVARVVGLE